MSSGQNSERAFQRFIGTAVYGHIAEPRKLSRTDSRDDGGSVMAVVTVLDFEIASELIAVFGNPVYPAEGSKGEESSLSSSLLEESSQCKSALSSNLSSSSLPGGYSC
ncbi:unnamed protein product [Calypogeia fissa]